MSKKSLLETYDEIKSEIGRPEGPMSNPGLINVMSTPGVQRFRMAAKQEADKLSDGCAKRIIMDIYMKCVPLDQSFIQGNRGILQQDVDNMLASKGQTATQYLTSGYEKSKAPVLEFVLRACRNIGRKFVEDAEETLKDAQTNNIEIQPPEADVEDEEVQNTLIDVEKDMEVETFMDKLKQKTIDKIVQDVSDIINDRKEGEDMTFDIKSPGTPPPGDDLSLESTIAVVMDHINYRLMKEKVLMNEKVQSELIGLAVREATLYMIDRAFEQPNSDFRQHSTRIRSGKGSVLNESVIASIIMEAAGESPISTEEKTMAKNKFGDHKCVIVKNAEGKYVAKNSKGNKSEPFESISEIPKDVIKFMDK